MTPRDEALLLGNDLALSDEPADRRAAAAALGLRGAAAGDHAALASLLADPDPSVRASALDAVVEGAEPP